MRNIHNRTIYVNDNLNILRGINSGTVDMIYLDPPFNSKKSWSAPIGSISAGAVFKDTWNQSDIDNSWVEEIKAEHPALHSFLSSMKLWAEKSDLAYMTYMSIRIIECHRVLKNTGTLWYHCDHYMNDLIKVMLDIIFGRGHDLNNVVWAYSGGGLSRKNFPKKHDNLFWYRKGDTWTYNEEYRSYSEKTAKMNLSRKRNSKGTPITDWWIDIAPVTGWMKERLGYPTQKPIALLDRIIKASTNKGDFVLDPFCGCATTCVAAEELGRQWVGIDISSKAGDIVRDRINKQIDGKIDFELREMVPINVESLPPVRSENDRESKGKYIYVFSHVDIPNEYKVGIATDYKKRLGGYKTSHPNREGWRIEYTELRHDYREVEKATHEHFPNQHEWVRAELKNIINFIENYE